MVERTVRDREAGGSNPLAPTISRRSPAAFPAAASGQAGLRSPPRVASGPHSRGPAQPTCGGWTAFIEQARTGFSRTFWIANIIELFERFAYYGSKAILAVYVAEQVGLGPEKAGWLVGSLFNTLLYFLPILAGTIVDRYGFKKSLLACFSIFCVGYFLIGLGGLPAGKPLVDALGADDLHDRRAGRHRDRRLADQAVDRRHGRAHHDRGDQGRSATRSTTRW